MYSIKKTGYQTSNVNCANKEAIITITIWMRMFINQKTEQQQKQQQQQQQTNKNKQTNKNYLPKEHRTCLPRWETEMCLSKVNSNKKKNWSTAWLCSGRPRDGVGCTLSAAVFYTGCEARFLWQPAVQVISEVMPDNGIQKRKLWIELRNHKLFWRDM